jgi:hypothetical protein
MRLVLRHLETVGFDGAPRLLGQDEFGHWILTFVAGDVALPPWPDWVARDATLASVATLLRRFHKAVAGLRPPTRMRWPTTAPRGYEGNVVGHMDVSMANVVCRNGEAVALIDFEEVGMVAAVWDVVRTARHWVPLIDPADLTGGLRSLAGRHVDRLQLFLDAYHLGEDDRARFVDAVLLNADVTYEQMRQGAAAGHPGYVREWTGHAAARNRRGRRWVEAHRRELERVVSG